MFTRAVFVLFALFTLGCLNGGKGVLGDTAFLGISDGEVVCDPFADAFDDLFYANIYTYGDVTEVEVTAYPTSGPNRTFPLSERGPGTWYGEAWGDDLNMDCDDIGRVQFEVVARGPDGSASVIYE
ncbi:hypothetical protein L6R49_23440 [Myxococcota bacterium]|nr:hypothetical protein [Myxococcota bacterium]